MTTRLGAAHVSALFALCCQACSIAPSPPPSTPVAGGAADRAGSDGTARRADASAPTDGEALEVGADAGSRRMPDAETPEAAETATSDLAAMVPVPAGSFWMGRNEALKNLCDDNEKPYHEVTLGAFEIDPTEVTVAAYAECVACGAPSDEGCTQGGTKPGTTNYGKPGLEQHPVNCVDWSSAAPTASGRASGFAEPAVPAGVARMRGGEPPLQASRSTPRAVSRLGTDRAGLKTAWTGGQ